MVWMIVLSQCALSQLSRGSYRENGPFQAMADPNIRLGATSCGGSRHSAKGGADLICFSVFHVYFFIGGGTPKSIAKLDGGHGRMFPLDTPLSPGVFAVVVNHLEILVMMCLMP